MGDVGFKSYIGPKTWVFKMIGKIMLAVCLSSDDCYAPAGMEKGLREQ